MMRSYLQKGTPFSKGDLGNPVMFNESWAGRELLKRGLLPMFAKDGL